MSSSLACYSRPSSRIFHCSHRQTSSFSCENTVQCSSNVLFAFTFCSCHPLLEITLSPHLFTGWKPLQLCHALKDKSFIPCHSRSLRIKKSQLENWEEWLVVDLLFQRAVIVHSTLLFLLFPCVCLSSSYSFFPFLYLFPSFFLLPLYFFISRF